MDSVEIEKGLLLTKYCAAYYAPYSLGVVSDMHIGYEAAAADDGALIPRTNRERIMETMKGFISDYNPSILVVNGDFKHMFRKNSPQEWWEVKEVLKELLRYVEHLVIVRGNHDNFLRAILPDDVDFVEYVRFGQLWMTHGHRKLSFPESYVKVLGHEHPTFLLRDEVGVGVRLKCYLYHRKRRILILPAVSSLSKGTHIHSRGFFSPSLQRIEPNEMEVYAIGEIGILHMS